MARLRASLILVGFLGLTLASMPIQAFLVLVRAKAARNLPCYYHRIMIRLLGVTVTVKGIPPTAPALLVSNHVSWLDIPALSAALPLSFIAKREVAGWPLFGWMAKLQRTVFINRESRISTHASTKEIEARLQNNEVLVLFPEGTSGDGKSVKPFKSSYFSVVDQLSVPVIPVILAFRGQHGLPLTKRQRPSLAWYGDMDLLPHLWAALKAGPITLDVRFCEALPKAHRKVIAKQAEATIRKGLVEALHASPDLG
ncbi:MAG: 1-acyl-sn-glycerol-3-phosphate acyltransferase [Alphaproteobacteria bacterium]|nr:1-acyl-sn-glycerol-3-phosphate acyltransferase [Alphaproteobacteria bacterium]